MERYLTSRVFPDEEGQKGEETPPAEVVEKDEVDREIDKKEGEGEVDGREVGKKEGEEEEEEENKAAGEGRTEDQPSPPPPSPPRLVRHSYFSNTLQVCPKTSYCKGAAPRPSSG